MLKVKTILFYLVLIASLNTFFSCKKYEPIKPNNSAQNIRHQDRKPFKRTNHSTYETNAFHVLVLKVPI
jgi:hypothetical protein